LKYSNITYREAIVSESRVISMDNMIEALIAQLGPEKVEERRRQVQIRLEQEEIFRYRYSTRGASSIEDILVQVFYKGRW
jgi:hypothetical protein